MTSLFVLWPLLLPAAGMPRDVVRVSAHIDADRLEVGQEYALVLDVRLKDGWSSSGSGVPNAILQIKVPRSVELVGKVLKTPKELGRNEYLRAPFERLIKDNPTRVMFKLLGKPRKKDGLRFNILAYVHHEGTDDYAFIRRRYKIRLKPEARASRISPRRSDWGVGKELQLQDKAVSFKLPRADGTRLSLKKYLGKKNVVVTTYRAFW